SECRRSAGMPAPTAGRAVCERDARMHARSLTTTDGPGGVRGRSGVLGRTGVPARSSMNAAPNPSIARAEETMSRLISGSYEWEPAANLSLFDPQRGSRLEARCAPRGDDRRDQRNGCEDGDHYDERREVARIGAHHIALPQATDSQ